MPLKFLETDSKVHMQNSTQQDKWAHFINAKFKFRIIQLSSVPVDWYLSLINYCLHFAPWEDVGNVILTIVLEGTLIH